jgi:hypothetical protein
MVTTPSQVTPVAAEPTPSGWSCVGDPPDVAPGWKTELAIVPTSSANALEKALQNAQDKLRTKLCVNADRDRSAADACAFLAAHIEPWKTGRTKTDTCASAVIKQQYIDEWAAVGSDLEGFDVRLAASARVFVDAVRAARAKLDGARSAKGAKALPPPRIALAAVYDDNDSDPRQNQLPGGRRADWLASRFKTNFVASGGLVSVPKGWVDPQPPPAETHDVIIVGHMYKKAGTAMARIEVSWTGYSPDGRQLETSSGSFPEAGGPPGPQFTPPPLPTTSGLYLSMDSDHHGSLCAGDTTQLWLKSSEALHVRVFDLYGRDGAMLLFPERGTSDLVPAGKTIPLGDERGFQAVPTPGTDNERYLVIGAPAVAGLGVFAAAEGPCRLSPDAGAALHRGESIPPGAKTGVTGYRVLTGVTCPRGPTAEYAKAAMDVIQRLPICKR